MTSDQALRDIFMHALKEEYDTDEILLLPDGQTLYLSEHLQLTQGPQNNIHVLNRLQMSNYTVSSESLQIPLRDGLITPEPYTANLPDSVMQFVYPIAGTSHLTREQKAALENITTNPGAGTVILVAEPDNPHDPQAIAIRVLADGQTTRIGYIAATSTKFVHPSLSHDMAPSITSRRTSYGTQDYTISLEPIVPSNALQPLAFEDVARLQKGDTFYIPANPHPLQILDILPTVIRGRTYPRLIIGNRLGGQYAVSMRYLISNQALYQPAEH